jgi:hypothetical protein
MGVAISFGCIIGAFARVLFRAPRLCVVQSSSRLARRLAACITRKGGSLLRPAQVQCVLGIRYFLMRGTLVHAVCFPSGDGIFARSGTVTIATKAV